jgi:hypothetical protein|tara:strand:+ start:7575 stop:8210 length:636 start_codon:yes stop_codon:yes gene_type:complete
MSNGSFSEDVDRLFQNSDVAEAGGAGTTSGSGDWSTLDESVWQTLRRDVDRVVVNTRSVLWPFQSGTRDRSKPLREWDLWGPLVFVLTLGVTLSSNSEDASTVFSIVFATVAFGAVALTLNVVLLGGHIIFLQAISLMGYCMFPLNVSAVLMKASNFWVWRVMLATVAVIWSSHASVPFITHAVSAERKALAVYPVMLLYISLAMLCIVSA